MGVVLKWNGTRTYPECDHRGWVARCDSCNEVIGRGRNPIPHVDAAAFALRKVRDTIDKCRGGAEIDGSKRPDLYKAGIIKGMVDALYVIDMALQQTAPPAQQPAQGIDLGQLPDGWSLRTLATCYQLSDGNQVVANLVGPDAERNAQFLAILIDQRDAAPGVGNG